MIRKFKVLMYAGEFVDEGKLGTGIYTKAVPTLHNEKSSIEERIKIGQKFVDMFKHTPMAKQEWQDQYAANLQQCEYKTVTLIIE